MNASTTFPRHINLPQQHHQQPYNVPNYQKQPSCCAHCIYGAGQLRAKQFQNSPDAARMHFSTSPTTSSDSGHSNHGQASVNNGSPAHNHTLACLTLHSSQATRLKAKNCNFCFKNGEQQCVYGNHELKNDQGIVLCPILRRYICDICGSTGDQAHTRKYCPYNAEVSAEKPVSRRLPNRFIGTNNNRYFK